MALSFTLEVNIWAQSWVWTCYSLELFTLNLKDYIIIWYYIWQYVTIQLSDYFKMRTHSRDDFVSTCNNFALDQYSSLKLYRTSFALYSLQHSPHPSSDEWDNILSQTWSCQKPQNSIIRCTSNW